MGFFKKLGKSLKKVVSIKTIGNIASGAVKSATKSISLNNLKNAVSGDFSSIVKDVSGRAVGGFWNSLGSIGSNIANDTVNGFADQVISTTADVASNDKGVQNVVSSLATNSIRGAIQALWNKWRKQILIGAGCIVAVLVYWFGFHKKRTTTRRARR